MTHFDEQAAVQKVFLQNMGRPLADISAILAKEYNIKRTPEQLRALLSASDKPDQGMLSSPPPERRWP